MIWAAEGSPHRDEVFSRGLFTPVLDVHSSFNPPPSSPETRSARR
jgi:hypothetical protein